MNNTQLQRANEIKSRIHEINEELLKLPRIISDLKTDNTIGIMGIRLTLPKQAIQGQLQALKTQLEVEQNSLKTEFDAL